MSEGPVPLTALSGSQRAQALDRFAVLRPFLEDGVPLAGLARQRGIAPRTAQRWLARYRREGLAGLARRARRDRGGHRLPRRLQACIERLALQRPRRSIAAIQRQAATVATEQSWPVPGYKQVYAIVRTLDPALLTLAHEGDKAYREAFDLLHRHEAPHPNALWQADHTQLDIWLLDDTGRPARPWLTVSLDDYSRAVAGYYLTFAAPSAIGMALALHQAIWRKGDARWPVCGIPDRFYTDHGSDFTSRHLEQVAADLHLRLVFSLPGQPRERGKIERFFGTINQLFLGDQPGYIPASAPLPSQAGARQTLTLAGLDARFRARLLDEYHPRPHGETGEAPATRWAAGSFLPRLPDALGQLDLLLLTVPKARRVRRDGIHFQGLRYLDPTLAAYLGEDVTIRYDPRDLAELRVYHRDAFLCRAICPEVAGATLSLKDITAARDRRRRQLRQELIERAAVVEALTAARRADATEAPVASPESPAVAAPRLKRYRNE